MLLNYSLQSALPKIFTSRNVNNLVFASQLMISSKPRTYLDTFDEDQKENKSKIYHQPMVLMFCLHCTRRRVLKKLELHVSCCKIFRSHFSSNLVNIDQ